MIRCIRVKEGVEFTVIAAAGFFILATLLQVAQLIDHDITITSACEGAHSGPDDPHHLGKAYDVRTHDLPDPLKALNYLQSFLGMAHFYAFLEDEGTPNEHIHVQQRKDTVFPPVEVNNSEAVQDATAGDK